MLKSTLSRELYGVDLRTLMRWINHNAELLDSLKKVGYKPSNKILTSMQISLIRKYLG